MVCKVNLVHKEQQLLLIMVYQHNSWIRTQSGRVAKQPKYLRDYESWTFMNW